MNIEKQLDKISKNLAEDETLFAVYSKGSVCMAFLEGDMGENLKTIYSAMKNKSVLASLIIAAVKLYKVINRKSES